MTADRECGVDGMLRRNKDRRKNMRQTPVREIVHSAWKLN